MLSHFEFGIWNLQFRIDSFAAADLTKNTGRSVPGEMTVGVERKGVQGIRTMGALVDSRRTRTAAGALLELSAMANEKLLLHKELDRWKNRNSEIQKRLGEIAAKEQRLMSMVQSAPETAVAAPAPPIETPAGQRVKVKEFSY